MNNLFRAIARAFTVPRAVRNQLDANPVVQGAKAVLLPGLLNDLADGIDSRVSDPAAAALIKAELGHLIQSSGIAN